MITEILWPAAFAGLVTYALLNTINMRRLARRTDYLYRRIDDLTNALIAGGRLPEGGKSQGDDGTLPLPLADPPRTRMSELEERR